MLAQEGVTMVVKLAFSEPSFCHSHRMRRSMLLAMFQSYSFMTTNICSLRTASKQCCAVQEYMGLSLNTTRNVLVWVSPDPLDVLPRQCHSRLCPCNWPHCFDLTPFHTSSIRRLPICIDFQCWVGRAMSFHRLQAGMSHAEALQGAI